MASYFAEVDQSGVVLRVIVAEQDYINSGRIGNPSNWIECFLDEDGEINRKKMYPSKGWNYNSSADVFYSPQPYPSWALDEYYDWQPPVPRPESGDYVWNEASQSWDNIDPVE